MTARATAGHTNRTTTLAPTSDTPHELGGLGRKMLGELHLVREGGIPAPDHFTQWASLTGKSGHEDGDPAVVAKNAAAFMAPYVAREETESLWALALDLKGHVIDGRPIIVSRGNIQQVMADPRALFRALMLDMVGANAAGFIVAHNHPDDDETPSPEDKVMARRMAACGDLLGIPLLDAMVLTRAGRYTSFRAEDDGAAMDYLKDPDFPMDPMAVALGRFVHMFTAESND